MNFERLYQTLIEDEEVEFHSETALDQFLDWMDQTHPLTIVEVEGFEFIVALAGSGKSLDDFDLPAPETEEKIWGLTDGYELLELAIATEEGIKQLNDALVESSEGSRVWVALTDLELHPSLLLSLKNKLVPQQHYIAA